MSTKKISIVKKNFHVPTAILTSQGPPLAVRLPAGMMRPEATETISYRIPAFKYKGVLVWFAAFSNHCSLFPTASVIEAFMNELKCFSTSKGTIHFPTDKPLPTALVKKLVKARVAQNESKLPRQ